MEHSKLPWITVHIDNIRKNGRPEALEIWGGVGCNTLIAGWTENESGQGITELELLHAAFIVKACNEHDTLKAKEKLLDEIITSHSKMKRCCQYLRDGFGVVACPECQHATFDTLLDIEQILSKAKELK